MKTSARNYYEGAVMTVRHGAVNDEVEILFNGSNTRVTAIITNASCKAMGLEPGKMAVVLIKEESVILVTDSDGVRFSSRNIFPGTVVSIKENGGIAYVNMRLIGGEPLSALVSSEALSSLGIKAGDKLSAIVKAPAIVVGVKV
ncbi:MAG: TOBE domain-containing protein [Synergistaceae bacterium]|jgi:molybdate transport system regulatory protein|nr:TOBE domain-containing protein [Synergistaceae bacterium]